MLTIRHMDTFYGRAQVLFGVDLEVARGQVVALLGRNGVGKSTTLKSIVGLVPPSAGEVRFDGRSVLGTPPHELARLGIGYVPEERRIFASLTVEQNLEVGRQAARPGVPAWTPERLFELFPNLARVRRNLGGRISGGEQQMLAVARTLMGNPSLILLDEPSEGLAPRVVEHLAAMIDDLRAAGLTVLLSEQNLRLARRVADRAAVMESGQVRWHGPMADFSADTAAQKAFLRV
jgi:branched-chain amino acid transport system ATP-binding protein